MLPFSFGVHRVARRSLRSAAASALAFTALAGGVMFSGEAANASCSGPTSDPLDPTANCTFSDPTALPAPTIDVAEMHDDTGVAGTQYYYELTLAPYPTPQTQIVTEFPMGYTGAPVDSVFSIVKATLGWFDQVRLVVESSGPTIVTKEVFANYDKNTGVLSNKIIPDLVANGPDTIIADLPGNYVGIFVRDTINPNGGNVGIVENEFRQTPGPLPILGAGAAFGFSRKLRGRIKASRQG